MFIERSCPFKESVCQRSTFIGKITFIEGSCVLSDQHSLRDQTYRLVAPFP